MTEDLTERVRALSRNYSDEAEVYDRLWAPVLRDFVQPLLDRLPPDAAALLDVGTGTGALLGDLQARFSGATVVGIDRAEGMIRRAPRGFGRAVTDVHDLPFRDASFDAVTMLFMLFHLADPAGALARVRTVLRPGGAVAVATWGAEDHWPQLDLWHELLSERDAPPGESILSRHELTDEPDKIAGLLGGAGFGRVDTWIQTFERPWTTDDVIDYATGMAVARRRLLTLPEDEHPGLIAQARVELDRLPAAAKVHRPTVVFGIARS